MTKHLVAGLNRVSLKKYSLSAWRKVVAKGDTCLGYLAWVEYKQEGEQFEKVSPINKGKV